jgi:hypothetical protein
MSHSIEILHPAFIDLYWEEMLPHIDKVVEVSNYEFTADSIRLRALNLNSVMVVVRNLDKKIVAVTTAEVVTYDSGLRSLLLPIIGGDGLYEWGDEWFRMMKHLAKYLNCTELRGLAARDGWLKLLKSRGWNENHTVITYQLNQE